MIDVQPEYFRLFYCFKKDLSSKKVGLVRMAGGRQTPAMACYLPNICDGGSFYRTLVT